MRRAVWCVAAVAVFLAAGVAWAIEEGDKTPSLKIKPVNSEETEPYDVIEKMGEKCVIFFIDVAGSDDESREDGKKLMALAQHLHNDKLPSAVIMLMPRTDATEDVLRKVAKENKFTAPLAVLDPKDEQLTNWHLEGHNNIIFIAGSKVLKVFHSFAEIEKAFAKG